MSDKSKRVFLNILDFIFLMLSYMLCDFVSDKINLVTGIVIGLVFYMIISYGLHKIFKIKE